MDVAGAESAHVEPRDELEFALAGVWKQVLGIERIGVTDNFFEMGGHSLLAAKLFARIEKLAGRQLPLALLFRAPTIAGLAALLRDSEWEPDWSSLVAIRPAGEKAPLYLVHGAEGNVLLYRELAECLPADRPVFGLQSPALSGRRTAPGRLEDLAAWYIEEIQAVQPTGPYCLGGYCLGGTIALEMARQLESRGESVSLVALLETYNIQVASRGNVVLRRCYHFLQNLRFHLDNLLAIPNRDRLKFLRKKTDVERARLGLTLARAGRRLLRPFTRGASRGGWSPRVTALSHQAQESYQPKPYHGRVVLFRPERNFRWLDDPAFGWGHVVTGRLEIEKLPLSPRGMLVEPFVRLLAERLAKAMEAGEGR